MKETITYQQKIQAVEKHYLAIKKIFPRSNPFLLLHHIEVDLLPAYWLIEQHKDKAYSFKVAYFRKRSAGLICFEV